MGRKVIAKCGVCGGHGELICHDTDPLPLWTEKTIGNRLEKKQYLLMLHP